MALKELKINAKNPKDLTGENEEDNDLGFDIALEGEDDDTTDDDSSDENLEQLDEEDDQNTDEGSDDDDEEQSEDDSADEEEDEDELAEKTKFGQRANNRIRTLVEERNIARASAQEALEARAVVEKRLVETQKATVETGKKILGNHIKSLKDQMVSVQNSESDDKVKALVDLQEQLNKAQIDLNELENFKVQTVVEDEDSTKDSKNNKGAAVKTMADAPVAVQKWASKNTWFQNPVSAKDKERQQEAIIYSEILVKDGYSMESKEFFDKIDERLTKLGLARTNKNKVQSKEDKNNSSDNGRKTPKKISQKLQGGSRNPNLKSQSQRRTITLSVEQQKIADLYGMTHEEYAFELMKIEDAEKQGKRMVTTFK